MRRAINIVVELVAVVMAPIALVACAMAGVDQAALLSLVVAVASLVLFFAGYEKNAPRLRDTMPVVVLAALAAAGRILFAPFPSFKPALPSAGAAALWWERLRRWSRISSSGRGHGLPGRCTDGGLSGIWEAFWLRSGLSTACARCSVAFG